MSKNKIIWTVLVLTIVVVVISINKKTTDSEVIKLGVIAPLSGPAANIGEEIVNSIKLASSSSLQLLFEDDACDTKKAIFAYQKLKQEGVKIFNVNCSGSVLALAPIAKQDGNLIVTGFSGSSEIRKTGDEVIRFIPDALSIAGAMANYLSTSTSKIALLYEEQDYSRSVANILKEKLGNKIMNEEKYIATDTTYKTQIVKLKSLGIQTLLYVPTSDKAAQLVYKEMNTLNFKPLIVGDVNVCEYPFSPKEYGLSAICYDAAFTVETEGYKNFVSDYKTTYGKESTSPFYHSITYDIVKILETYINQNGQTDLVNGFKKYLLSGVTGRMTAYNFTPEGEVIADDYLKQFKR
jgi:ABC-type branched-subunit amino acid transport system substrate-binding protein